MLDFLLVSWYNYIKYKRKDEIPMPNWLISSIEHSDSISFSSMYYESKAYFRVNVQDGKD